MFDFFTYFIYLGLLCTMLLLTYRGTKIPTESIDKLYTKDRLTINLKYFLFLIIISIIVGYRYNVGVDWDGYRIAFLESGNLTFEENSFEFAYFTISKIMNLLGFGYQQFFFLINLFTWYFIFKSIPKKLLFYFIFFLFCTEFFFWSMNGIRQFTAISLFLFSIKYILDKQLIKFILTLIFAGLFHKSAFIFFPLYFIPYKKLYNRTIMLIIFLFSFLFGNISRVVEFIEETVVALTLLYSLQNPFIERYFILRGGLLIEEDITLGLGYLFIVMSNLFLLLMSRDIVEKNPGLKIYYFLFFIGAVIYNFSYSVLELIRLNQYFIIFKVHILTFTTYYFIHYSKKNFISYLLVFLFFILFLAAIYNSSNMSNPYRIM